MIPIPIYWTQYQTTMRGRALKSVTCENCLTEYLYMMERQSEGFGTSVYAIGDAEAEANAISAAQEILTSVLEKDYDLIPCPECGSFQRHMFPKLRESKWIWIQVLMIAVILIGAVDAVGVLYWAVSYLLEPSHHGISRLVMDLSILLPVCVAVIGLAFLKKYKIRKFNPNLGDPQMRIALGRSRAVTRSEYEQFGEGIWGGKLNLNAP